MPRAARSRARRCPPRRCARSRTRSSRRRARGRRPRARAGGDGEAEVAVAEAPVPPGRGRRVVDREQALPVGELAGPLGAARPARDVVDRAARRAREPHTGSQHLEGAERGLGHDEAVGGVGELARGGRRRGGRPRRRGARSRPSGPPRRRRAAVRTSVTSTPFAAQHLRRAPSTRSVRGSRRRGRDRAAARRPARRARRARRSRARPRSRSTRGDGAGPAGASA